ncbi:uncharacterized protein LAJ45_04273 [Morchella importuna]|uniref:uncharacterized protein n=1 Tax=Morchella importuna TaxID=1174673 RepID=UPI001E8E16AF|nr:uncharacterized protein LAJ45_04273 [Morchella importuna]KAH8151651.1 hypothetical protein LAJ45_04273 [Morchella importuna]
MSSERSDAEALLPPHMSTEEYAAYTHFSSPKMTTMSTTISTNIATTAPTTNYFSPLKRKRDRSPLGVPETPWRLQPALTDEDDEATDVETADDLEVITPSSGQASPRSRRLASQLEDLNLSVARPIFTSGDLGIATAATTMTTGQPAAKKPKNKTRLIATTMTKAGNRSVGVLTKNNDGDSSMDGSENGHIQSAEVTAKEKGGVEWVDEPPLATRSVSNGGDEMEEDRNNNNHTKRARLRSPPLSRMDTGEGDEAVVMDENEDVDSNDTEQLGIGYRPTPTQRYVRSQKRMQQIKEYKARISKEAREKRSESRRRRRSFPERQQVAAGESAQNEGSDEGGRKKTVQFKIDPVV